MYVARQKLNTVLQKCAQQLNSARAIYLKVLILIFDFSEIPVAAAKSLKIREFLSLSSVSAQPPDVNQASRTHVNNRLRTPQFDVGTSSNFTKN